MCDEHVSKDEKGQPCIAARNGTSNELYGSLLAAGCLYQQFQDHRYNGVPRGDVPGRCSLVYKALA